MAASRIRLLACLWFVAAEPSCERRALGSCEAGRARANGAVACVASALM